MAAELRGRMGADWRKAERLIRTEVNFYSNQGEMAAYEESGVEEYEFLATLDLRTSDVCQEHDGKRYPLSAAVVGENWPPLHSNCRSTTVAVIEGFEERLGERIARDPVTGKSYKVPANIDYETWKSGLTKEQGDALRFSPKRAADIAQFEKYHAVFGDKAGKDVAEFQALKYNKPEEWNALKRDKQGVLNAMDYKKSMTGRFGDYEVRSWYVAHDKQIAGLIDTAEPIENQARQAHELRNTYRFQAREMMSNQALRLKLDINFPNMSFDEQIQDKINRKGLSREQAILDILMTADKSNIEVNKQLGVD